LLGRGRVPASSAVDVEAIKQFFADKVANVRQNTSGAPPPTFSSVRSGVSFDEFKTKGAFTLRAVQRGTADSLFMYTLYVCKLIDVNTSVSCTKQLQTNVM